MSDRIRISDLNIIERLDIKGNPYYILFDNEKEMGDKYKSFFAFSGKVKEGWDILKNNYKNLKELDIEFENDDKGNKVIGVYSDNEQDFFI